MGREGRLFARWKAVVLKGRGRKSGDVSAGAGWMMRGMEEVEARRNIARLGRMRRDVRRW